MLHTQEIPRVDPCHFNLDLPDQMSIELQAFRMVILNFHFRSSADSIQAKALITTLKSIETAQDSVQVRTKIAET